MSDDTKLANLLVKNYADVKAQDRNKQSALHLVCIRGNLEMFKLLLDACYQANEGIDSQGRTPLEYAKKNNHTKIVEFTRKTTHMLYSIESYTLGTTTGGAV